jgi:hypothetical protein
MRMKSRRRFDRDRARRDARSRLTHEPASPTDVADPAVDENHKDGGQADAETAEEGDLPVARSLLGYDA